MAQLYYRYSTMNAGKSLEIIKVANNYEELGKRVMCLVPEVDDRYERDMVTSRVGLSHKAYTVDDDTNIMTLFIEKNMRHQIDCVLVDENPEALRVMERRFAGEDVRWHGWPPDFSAAGGGDSPEGR